MLSESQYGIIGSVAAAVALAAFAKAAETYRAQRGVARSRTTYMPCRRTATLEVLVVHDIAVGNGPPVPDALIEVDEAGLYAYSPGNGTPATFTVPPGTYTVRALKNWYLPEDGAEQAGVVLDAGARVRVTLRMSSFELHLHVDADRDGAVDVDRTGLDRWNWGAGQKGAVVLCNNDDDDAVPKNASDNAVGDGVINGAGDLTDIAPLDLRRSAEGIAQPPGTWRATLAVTGGMEANLRIFATRTAGAAAVIGPGAGPSHTFAAGDFNNVRQLELGMEAVRYAGAGFTGEVDITFTLTRPATGFWAYLRDEFSYTERVRVRVAPWLMFHHSDPAQELYIRDMGAPNAALRAALQPLVNPILGANPTEVAVGAADRWMQDCMEIGYSRLPGRPFVPAVLKMPPSNGLNAFPPTLRGGNFGYHEVGVQGSNSRFDAGGNLEATPPAKAPDGYFQNGKTFPFGRIYFCPSATGLPSGIGDYADSALAMDASLRQFLRAQVVQSPIELDSSWLTVGHVDEIVSFVPCAGPQYMAYRLLIASPRRAYEILDNLEATGDGNELLLTGFTPGPLTVHDFLTTGLPFWDFDGEKMRADNDFCQARLDAALAVLRRNLDLPGVIEVPVLFAENHMLPGLYDAFTADMVNLVVLGDRCIVPKAHGPGPVAVHPTQPGGYNMDRFEQDLYQQLNGIGVTPLFINEFAELHVLKGEIHCGTNVRRQPLVPPAWWEFRP